MVESVCWKKIAGAKRKETQTKIGSEFDEKNQARKALADRSVQPRFIASQCMHDQRVSSFTEHGNLTGAHRKKHVFLKPGSRMIWRPPSIYEASGSLPLSELLLWVLACYQTVAFISPRLFVPESQVRTCRWPRSHRYVVPLECSQGRYCTAWSHTAFSMLPRLANMQLATDTRTGHGI